MECTGGAAVNNDTTSGAGSVSGTVAKKRATTPATKAPMFYYAANASWHETKRFADKAGVPEAVISGANAAMNSTNATRERANASNPAGSRLVNASGAAAGAGG